MEWLIAFLVSFVGVGLRGLQTHNIVDGNFKAAGITSVLMGTTNVAMIGLVAADPYYVAIPVIVGSTLGVLTSMWWKRR